MKKAHTSIFPWLLFSSSFRLPLHLPFFPLRLCELLLDEEGPQVRQLPGAGNGEDNQLDKNPPDDAGIGALGLITEFGFAFL